MGNPISKKIPNETNLEYRARLISEPKRNEQNFINFIVAICVIGIAAVILWLFLS